MILVYFKVALLSWPNWLICALFVLANILVHKEHKREHAVVLGIIAWQLTLLFAVLTWILSTSGFSDGTLEICFLNGLVFVGTNLIVPVLLTVPLVFFSLKSLSGKTLAPYRGALAGLFVVVADLLLMTTVMTLGVVIF